MVEELLNDSNSEDVFFMGDFNGSLGSFPHTTFQTDEMETLVIVLPKENDPDNVGRIDHIYVSTSAYDTRLNLQQSFMILPEHYGETDSEFDVYSDHKPVFVHVKASLDDPVSISRNSAKTKINSTLFDRFHPLSHYCNSPCTELYDAQGRVFNYKH